MALSAVRTLGNFGVITKGLGGYKYVFFTSNKSNILPWLLFKFRT